RHAIDPGAAGRNHPALRRSTGRSLRLAAATTTLRTQPQLFPHRPRERRPVAALSRGAQCQGRQSQALLLPVAGHPRLFAAAAAASAVALLESSRAVPADLSGAAAACPGQRNPDAAGRNLQAQPAADRTLLVADRNGRADGASLQPDGFRVQAYLRPIGDLITCPTENSR